MPEQLTLPAIKTRDDATFENFYPNGNESILKALQQTLIDPTQFLIYLFGQPGAGRTHLLQSVDAYARENGHTSIYIPLKGKVALAPKILDNLEHFHFVCLDEINEVAGQSHWEEGLLHFYNRLKANGHHLIVSGNVAPANLPILLADLKSRLGWGLSFQVNGLTDEGKLAALQMRAKRRGMHLSDECARYIMRHFSRASSDLFDFLEQLDKATLAQKRPLTIPFIRSALKK